MQGNGKEPVTLPPVVAAPLVKKLVVRLLHLKMLEARLLRDRLHKPHDMRFGKYQELDGHQAARRAQVRAEAVKRETTTLHVLLSAANGNVHTKFAFPGLERSVQKDHQYTWLVNSCRSMEHTWSWWYKDVTVISPNLYIPFATALNALTLIGDVQARETAIRLGGPHAGRK